MLYKLQFLARLNRFSYILTNYHAMLLAARKSLYNLILSCYAMLERNTA